jgi:hypothetical protein
MVISILVHKSQLQNQQGRKVEYLERASNGQKSQREVSGSPQQGKQNIPIFSFLQQTTPQPLPSM